MLAEVLTVAVEDVAAAVTRLLVIRTVLAATFAVSLAIVIVMVMMVMMVMRLHPRGRRYDTKHRQSQRAQEERVARQSNTCRRYSRATPALLLEQRDALDLRNSSPSCYRAASKHAWQRRVMVADSRIGIGFIGCGDVALRSYVPGMAAVADLATTAAVYDADPARAEGLADDLAGRGLPRPRVVPTLEALLTDPEVVGVLNLTPAPFHYEVNVAALSAGKHLFTEKPLAGTVADAKSAIALANERGLIFLSAPAVMATNRFRWLKQQIEAGWLGRPTLAVAQMANMGPASWRDYKGDPAVFYSATVGPALDTGVYVLHAITGLFGPARRVEAFGGITIPRRPVLIPGREGQVIEVQSPDQILIHLDFGDNRFGQILSSFATPRSKAPALELHGERGTVSISQESWYDPDAAVDVWQRDLRSGAVADEQWTEAKPPGSSRTPHMVQAGPEHFASVLAGTEPPILTAEQATHVLEIILAASQSMQEGRVIALSDM